MSFRYETPPDLAKRAELWITDPAMRPSLEELKMITMRATGSPNDINLVAAVIEVLQAMRAGH